MTIKIIFTRIFGISRAVLGGKFIAMNVFIEKYIKVINKLYNNTVLLPK